MALRVEKQVPTIYFGRPGSLISLPWPKGDLTKPYERQTYDFLTGSGNHQVQQLTNGSRPYAVKWEALHYDNFAKIEEYLVGANGSGPFVLLDPSAANLLSANVASAGTLFRNPSEFISGGGSLGVISHQTAAAFIHRPRGVGSLRWLWSVAADATPNFGIAGLYRSWWGQPAIVGQPYTFSYWIRTDGVVDTSIQVSARLRWIDVSGNPIGADVSSGDTTITGWQRMTVTGTAPADTAFVYPAWYAVGGTITTGGSLYIDEPMLEYGSVANDWAPGTGIKPVQIIGLTDGVPFSVYMRQDVNLQLRELSR